MLSNEVKENSSRIFGHLVLILNPLHHCKSFKFRTLCPAKIQKEFGSRGIVSILLSTKISKIVSIMIWSILSYISCISMLWHLEDFRKQFLSQFLQEEHLKFHFQKLISTINCFRIFSWVWTWFWFLLVFVRMPAKGSFTDEQVTT